MKYKIIITKNNEYYKSLGNYRSKKHAYKKYHTIAEEVSKVVFDKRFINDKVIHPAEYIMYLITYFFP